MTRFIEVRLKDKTTDEYIDVVPEPERARRVFGIIEHRHQLSDDGSLSIFRETISATYSRHLGTFYNVETEDVSLAGYYAPGQFTSVRETQRDVLEEGPAEPTLGRD